MKPGALLVNAARGPIVSTAALLDALNSNHIRAALDVTDPEPLPPDHPLWSAPNCLITPHVAGSTPEFIHRAFRFGAQQLRRFIASGARRKIRYARFLVDALDLDRVPRPLADLVEHTFVAY